MEFKCRLSIGIFQLLLHMGDVHAIFVTLFLVQLSFDHGGWDSVIANLYARKVFFLYPFHQF